ncbi:MAG: hypothetical protein IPP60_03570 [Sphingobacteriales bacterium]|nr:hypothetical protein [Sphingobacteriales bacterium]
MQKKWLLTLVSLSILFFISGFLIKTNLRFDYWWMTLGISCISFIYYFIVTFSNKKTNSKVIGGNIAAIGIKFILTGFMLILYIIFSGMKNRTGFIFFFIAYGIFSVVSYAFSYLYKND